MNLDPEIKAMSTCYEELKDLDNEAKKRVIHWLVKKLELKSVESFSEKETAGKQVADKSRDTGGSPGNGNGEIADFETVADIFGAANPKTDADKTLVVATYLQVKSNLADMPSNIVQKELKHLGHGVTNITRSFELLEEAKPKLVIQTRKDGKSKQARKKYKVTNEGINAVKALLNGTE